MKSYDFLKKNVPLTGERRETQAIYGPNLSNYPEHHRNGYIALESTYSSNAL